MTAWRIVIADDHPLFRDALRQAIAEMLPGAEIAEAGSLDDVQMTLEATPETDLLLLDLNMPGMQGFSGLLFLRTQFPAVPIAIISANEEPQVMRRAFAFGAAGYVPKSAGPDKIRAALAAVLAGETWLPPGVGPEMCETDKEAGLATRLASLTPQQIRVLMMLSQGRLNKQIAYELSVSEATVKAHVSAILQKLRVENRTQAVILAGHLAADADAPQKAILRSAATAQRVP
ncbi:response regulator transcription factor [Rhodospirillaceae bacterium SYSU D60014]|uniref:response regulator n=1 Tax=Virgifigura deserti TaxID=2268457 RepID=UPI000E66DD84